MNLIVDGSETLDSLRLESGSQPQLSRLSPAPSEIKSLFSELFIFQLQELLR
jgi:hypothetical protein